MTLVPADTRNGIAFRFAEQQFQLLGLFEPCEGGRQKIEKRTKTLEVLALKVPFGSLLGVSESSPVAGAIQGSNPC